MNKVILLGRLTKDVETRYTQTNNSLVATFTLAVNRRFAKEGEERQTDFINIVAWGKTGEFSSKYFKKGLQVAVVGRLQNRSYEDNNGQKKYITEVIAEEAYFADSKKEEENNPFGNVQQSNPFAQGQTSEFKPVTDDDLPF